MPHIAMATGIMRTSVRLRTAYSASSQLSSVSAGPSRMAPKSTKVTPLRTRAHLLAELVELLGVAPERQAEDDAADEGRDEAGPVKRARDAIGQGGAGSRDHLFPRGGDQISPARLGDDRGDQQSGHHSSQHAEADLLDQ